MTRSLTLASRLFVVAAAFFLAVPPAYAQEEEPATRSREVGRPADKEEEFTDGRYVFVGIGVDRYEQQALWTQLDNAVNDVEAVRAMLTKDFGFESPDEWFLTDGEATRTNINTVIDGLYSLAPEDNVVFFFAGHGISAPLQVGERVDTQAYIVPVDVSDYPDTRAATRQYIQIEDLLEQLAELEVRHVLAIFDACESGVALNERNGLKTRGSASNFADPEVLMRRTSRHVLTSATGTQKALDENPDYPGNSLFTGWLLEGLRRAAAGDTEGERSPDLDANGALTVSELARFVIDTVTVRSAFHTGTADYQTPDHGTFQLDQRGELVIRLAVDPFMDFFRQAEEFSVEGQIEQLTEVVGKALALREEGPYVSYLSYLLASETGQDGAALEALRQLDAYKAEGRDIPIDPRGLRISLRHLEKICGGGGCDLTGGL